MMGRVSRIDLGDRLPAGVDRSGDRRRAGLFQRDDDLEEQPARRPFPPGARPTGTVLSILKDAETGQRGYLLTGRDEYLAPFRTAEDELEPAFARLRSLTPEHAAQSARTAALRRLAAEKMKELRETIALRRERGLDAALGVVLSDQGKSVMSEARRIVADSQDLEDQQLQQRTAASQAAVRGTLITFAVTTGMAVLLLIAVSYLQRRRNAGARTRRGGRP